MNIQAYASAKQLAIEEIAEKLDIDLSPSSLPNSHGNQQILELFRLQKIAANADKECECEGPDIDDVLAKIKGVKGVGPSLYKKLEKELRE